MAVTGKLPGTVTAGRGVGTAANNRALQVLGVKRVGLPCNGIPGQGAAGVRLLGRGRGRLRLAGSSSQGRLGRGEVVGRRPVAVTGVVQVAAVDGGVADGAKQRPVGRDRARRVPCGSGRVASAPRTASRAGWVRVGRR